MKKILNLGLLIILLVALTGCGSLGRKLKAFFGGKPSPGATQAANKNQKRSKYKTYSENNSVPHSSSRNYQRTTREKMENSSRLNAQEGSLWVMEGQGPYLFSQNTLRLEGDILNVKIEGTPRKQLTTKVKVIDQLLRRLKRAKRRVVASAVGAATGRKGKPGRPKAPEPRTAGKKGKEKELFDVDTVPVRIVEKLTDGSYRVRGGQAFMIDRREYKVIVTGVIRSSDISDGLVSASKMLDSKFDIVSPRREVKL